MDVFFSVPLHMYIFLKDNPVEAILESVDRAIEVIHYQAANTGGIYTREQRSNLRSVETCTV